MDFFFTIYGNQDGLDKNPVPFHEAQPNKKMIADKYAPGKFKTVFIPNIDAQVKKYNGYTAHVRASLAEYLIKSPDLRIKYKAQINILFDRSLKKKKEGKVYLFPDKQIFWHLNMIYFANDSRGDAENVGKGIIDAIHANDKYVQGAFPFYFDKKQPRVEVLITDNWVMFLEKFHQFNQKNFPLPRGAYTDK